MFFNKKILAFLLIPTFVLLYFGGVNENLVIAVIGIILIILNAVLNIVNN